jgi:hypothetical protein
MIIKNSNFLRQIETIKGGLATVVTSGRPINFTVEVADDGGGMGHLSYQAYLKDGILYEYDSESFPLDLVNYEAEQISGFIPTLPFGVYGGEFFNSYVRNRHTWTKTVVD